MIAVAGLPAAGKSSLARSIAAADARFVVIDKDSVVSPKIINASMSALTGIPEDRDSEHYRQDVLPHQLAAIKEMTVMLAAAGCPVLVDAPFLAQARVSTRTGIPLADIIRSTTGIPVTAAVWMTVEADEQRRRMVARGEPRDATKLASFDSYRATLTASSAFPPELATVWADAGAVYAHLDTLMTN